MLKLCVDDVVVTLVGTYYGLDSLILPCAKLVSPIIIINTNAHISLLFLMLSTNIYLKEKEVLSH